MNELHNLKNLIKMYDVERDPDKRLDIIQFMYLELYRIHGKQAEFLKVYRINLKITYNIGKTPCKFGFSENIRKYYFNEFTFSY